MSKIGIWMIGVGASMAVAVPMVVIAQTYGPIDADLPAGGASCKQAICGSSAGDLPTLSEGEMALFRLTAKGADGRVLSSESYWQGKDSAAYGGLTALAPAFLAGSVAHREAGGETELIVALANRGTVLAIEAMLTVIDNDGGQVLPAYLSDNYVSLPPGESRQVMIRIPAGFARGPQVSLRGWNVPAAILAAK